MEGFPAQGNFLMLRLLARVASELFSESVLGGSVGRAGDEVGARGSVVAATAVCSGLVRRPPRLWNSCWRAEVVPGKYTSVGWKQDCCLVLLCSYSGLTYS
ncbi:hypothetical protein OPV22_002938 [Ensete ventricosum]|uniref:Secreted protein n=1 Tax=Ensete ventricosum TaxID=4639 RepID=A0AAV8RZF4_ENSVE|nr:hypothetical protein OPV22_002938 [Ensete ventricosum]